MQACAPFPLSPRSHRLASSERSRPREGKRLAGEDGGMERKAATWPLRSNLTPENPSGAHGGMYLSCQLQRGGLTPTSHC